jgi:SAM-dependent methyltransferase
LDADILGRALRCATRPALSVEIEHSTLPAMPQPLDWWQREPGARAPVDVDVLDWVRAGRVIDVGCCTGRHLEILARRGVRGYGVEVTPAAVALAAGVSCVQADVFSYVPPSPVDTVLAIGGNGGLAGTLAELPGFLLRLSSWLTATDASSSPVPTGAGCRPLRSTVVRCRPAVTLATNACGSGWPTR